MTSINKVILVGRLGKDPEVRYSQNGDAIANFSLATSEYRKDANGMRVEQTEWHRVVAFKKLAEIVEQYLKKGALVYVEGSIKTRKWTGTDGVEKFTTEILVNQLQMLGGKGENEGGGKKGHTPKPHGGDDCDDQIPF